MFIIAKRKFKTLFILFLCIVVFLPIKIYAINEKYPFIHDFKDGEKIMLGDDTEAKYSSIYGLHLPDGGRIPMGKLNGNKAFCLDRGSPFGVIYTNTGITPSAMQLSAMAYFEKTSASGSSSSMMINVLTQMVMWYGDNGRSPRSIAESLLNYYNSLRSVELPMSAANSFLSYYTSIINNIISGKQTPTNEYCIWKSTDNTQNMLAKCDYGGTNNPSTSCDSTSSIGSCGTGSLFTDPKKWSCIAGNPKYHDDSTEQNEYCNIFCQEQVNTSFPMDNYSHPFLAGQYFTIGNNSSNSEWGPVSISGTRTCKMYYKNGSTYTPGVNYAGWLKDFNTMDNDVKNAYNAWQKENARVNNKVGGPQRVGECQVGTKPVEKKVGPATCKDKNSKIGVTGMCQKGNQITGSPLCGAGAYSRAGICYKQVQTPVYKPKYANDYIFNNKKYRDTAYCEGDSAPGYNGAYENAYKEAVNNRTRQLSKLNKCSTMNTKYTLQPNVSLNYGGDNKYLFNGNLVMDVSDVSNGLDKPVSTAKNGTNCSNGNCVIYQYTCTGKYKECSSKKVYGTTVNNVSVSDKTTTTRKIVSYKLPPGGYQYVDKITGEVHKTLPSNIRSTNTYIDLQQSVLPISIDRASGQYDISLTFNNVGNVGGNPLFDVKSPYSGVYSCKYNVKNQVLCSIEDCPISGGNGKKPFGLDVIYRPISLKTPFPGEDGKGRNTGSNWCETANCKNDNSQVNEYILKNRNVTGDAVYKLQPLYSITLTPSVIKQIRNYNKTTNYSDFNLTCKKGGTSCLSNFVQSSGYGFTGKCVGKSVNDFMLCADK